MSTWLMKSEPTCYSIDDLEKDGSSSWFWVRNYLARNYMRDQMQIGDRAFFYHSSCATPGISGLMEICSLPHPDETQFIPTDPHYDPKSTLEKPIWWDVDVKFLERYDRIISIRELRNTPGLEDMKILQKWNRLSITPLSDEEYRIISGLTRNS